MWSVPRRRRLSSISLTIHRREFPRMFGSSPMRPWTFVASTTSSRRPFSARPTISPDRRREHTATVPITLIPASRARWTMRMHSSSSGFPPGPNIMAPRHQELTRTPVPPRTRSSTASVPVAVAGDRHEARHPVGLRELVHRPPGPLARGQLLHQGHGGGVLAGRAVLDHAVGQGPAPDVLASLRPDDGEGPPTFLAESPEGDVRVLGGEVRALQAPRPGVGLGLLQRVGVLLSVPGVEEELPLHVDPDDVVERESELLLGDLDHHALVGERLRTQEAEGPGDLPAPLVHPVH